ncbi:MAG: (2Fe-2S)-binding protein [Pseudorhodoplanes sp.]|uniref:(2Fe-2S)-binding protein n=1 Tax=Pseudorhodoplanes sp. TaxID=1934341 RepID=UPI003D0AF35A
MSKRIDISLTVNGKRYQRSIEPRYLLADFLRHELRLTGTHIGCEQGVCGACTVLIDGRTARSCLHFAVTLDGASIITVEGLAGLDDLHPIQEAFRRNHALQCGYCTPGFLMTAMELLDANPHPTEAEARDALTNNVCRCTGYNNIVKAVLEAGRDLDTRATKGSD